MCTQCLARQAPTNSSKCVVIQMALVKLGGKGKKKRGVREIRGVRITECSVYMYEVDSSITKQRREWVWSRDGQKKPTDNTENEWP